VNEQPSMLLGMKERSEFIIKHSALVPHPRPERSEDVDE
jgi:hypothetical protein